VILGIDTSAGQCAVALLAGERVVVRAAAMARGHAEALFPMIDEVLAEAGAGPDALARIGVCTGPGSFTGIRAGVAAARGLALGAGIPAIGITRFEALAVAGMPGPVALPGRAGQVYVQEIGPDGAPAGPPRIEPGSTEDHPDDHLADPVVIARLAAAAAPGPRPAPLYLRGADADPPREAPPVMLD